MPAERWLGFAGSGNFGDIGGYVVEAVAGRTVAWRRVYRSGALTGLGAAEVAPLGIRTVVDLRAQAEAEDGGHPPWVLDGSVRLVPVPTGDSSRTQGPPLDGPGGLGLLYLAGFGRSGQRASFRRVLDVVADRSTHPVVVHCAGGKVRTGVAIALLLHLLGVADDDVVADYALTQQHVDRLPADRRVEVVADLAARGWPAAILDARAESMRAFLDGVRVGGASIAAALGVSDAVITALREALLD